MVDSSRRNKTGKPIDDVLPRLQGVRCHQEAGKWEARCPAHDDRKPSLGVAVGKDDRVLLHCQAGCPVEAIVKAIGLEMADLFVRDEMPNGGKRIVATYDYRDEAGILLYQSVRYDPKDFRQRQPDGKGGWIWSVKDRPLVLYRLPELLQTPPEQPVFVVEGEKDVEALRRLGVTATTNAMGAGKWRKCYNESLRGRHVILLPDNDEPGRKHMETVRRNLKGVAASVQTVVLPDLPPKGDVSDWLAAGGTAEKLRELAEAAKDEPQERNGQDRADAEGEKTEKKGGRQGRRAQADLLMELVEEAGAELFHAPGGHDTEEYATIQIGNHKETWPVCSKGFRRWLGRLYYERLEKAPGGQALQDALNVLAGKALHDGPECPVAVRVAEQGGTIWLDLANADWQAAEITSTGWRVTANPPIRFLRKRGLLPLPLPVSGGSVDELRPLVNLPDPDAWKLYVAWLVAALRPDRPFPVLIVNGEQGSAKSTLCKLARALVDPNLSPLRRLPLNERDLAIAASNSWVLAFDNLSGLPAFLSDALGSLATGGGLATRELYSDADEKLFAAMRPILLNGIENVATRPDLLDRALMLNLPTIPDERRRDEEQLSHDFEAVRPRVLGALLDAVSAALRNRPAVRLTSKPRMADFASWIVASEPALRWQAGAFLDAYLRNRGAANELALESSPAAGLVLTLLANRGTWEGTAADLLGELEKLADDKTRKRRDWPATARALSGQLRRLAPNLRQAGVSITFGHHRRTGTPIRLEPVGKRPSPPSPPSPPLPNKDLRCDGHVTVGDERIGGPSHRNPLPYKGGDDGDDGDGVSPTQSTSGEAEGGTWYTPGAEGCRTPFDFREPGEEG
jgi:hypothetical protein